MVVNQQCPSCEKEIPGNAPGGLCPSCVMKMGKAGIPGGQQNTSAWANENALIDVEDIARRLPNLDFIEMIGSGGMGTVFKARQKSLDRLVAVKLLSPRISKDPSFAERFNREARTLAKLNHPNIVAVYESGEIDGRYYIVMEYIDGINLREAIRARTLNADDALSIVPQICEALFYAHGEGVVHRDIKPENILLDKKGRVKIADFGLAKLLGQKMEHLTLTGTNQIVGTLNYMAPEQLEKPMAVDHRADIYSLGVVFYELLTGELPIGRFSAPSEFAACDRMLDQVVFRTLEKEPGRRYQTASEVKSAVETYQPDLECLQNADPRPGDPKKHSQINYRIPFSIPNVHGGFATADGILRFDGNAIEVEWQTKDSVFGSFKSGPHVQTIPVSEILWVRSKSRNGSRIAIQTDKLTDAERIPGSQSGTIKLNVGRSDRSMALAFVVEIQNYLDQPSDVDRPQYLRPPTDPFEEDEAKRRVLIPGLGLIAAGILNLICAVTVASLFAVTISRDESFLFVNEQGEQLPLPIAILIIGTFGFGIPLLLGAIAISGASRMLHLRNHGFVSFCCIVNLIPIHFGWLIAAPFGIWSLATLNRRSMKLTFDEIAALHEMPDEKPIVSHQKENQSEHES